MVLIVSLAKPAMVLSLSLWRAVYGFIGKTGIAIYNYSACQTIITIILLFCGIVDGPIANGVAALLSYW